MRVHNHDLEKLVEAARAHFNGDPLPLEAVPEVSSEVGLALALDLADCRSELATMKVAREAWERDNRVLRAQHEHYQYLRRRAASAVSDLLVGCCE